MYFGQILCAIFTKNIFANFSPALYIFCNSDKYILQFAHFYPFSPFDVIGEEKRYDAALPFTLPPLILSPFTIKVILCHTKHCSDIQ